MIAFELADDGTSQRCEYQGRERRRYAEQPIRLGPLVPHDKQQRRWMARHGKRGRRGARRVGPVVSRSQLMPTATIVRDVAHTFSDGHRTCVLYLPDGVKLTAEHGAVLKIAWR